MLKNWNDQSLFHSIKACAYIIGHRTSFEIQGLFPSSPTYKTMDPRLFEKEKKYFFFQNKNRAKKQFLLGMYTVKK